MTAKLPARQVAIDASGAGTSARADRAGLRRVAERVSTTVYRRMILLAETVPPAPGVAPAPVTAPLRDLEPDDVPRYLALRRDQSASDVAERLARGHRCRVACDGSRIVHAGWLARGTVRVPYLDADLVLGAGDVYSYDSFTARQWRGRALAPARHRDLLAGAAGPEAGRVLVLVAVENRSGLRVFTKLGYRAIGRYAVLRLGAWRRWWVESLTDEPVPPLRVAGDRCAPLGGRRRPLGAGRAG